MKVRATRLYYIRATFPPLRHSLRHSLLERHRCIHRLINHVYYKGQSSLLSFAPTTVVLVKLHSHCVTS